MREHAPARDHEARGLRREAGQRVGGLDREPVLVDPAPGDRAQALGRRHFTPHDIDADAGRSISRGTRGARAQPMTGRQAPGYVVVGPHRREQVVEAGQRRRVSRQAGDVARDPQAPVGERGLRVHLAAGERHRGGVVGLEAHVGRPRRRPPGRRPSSRSRRTTCGSEPRPGRARRGRPARPRARRRPARRRRDAAPAHASASAAIHSSDRNSATRRRRLPDDRYRASPARDVASRHGPHGGAHRGLSRSARSGRRSRRDPHRRAAHQRAEALDRGRRRARRSARRAARVRGRRRQAAAPGVLRVRVRRRGRRRSTIRP